MKAVAHRDMEAIVKQHIEKAKAGDVYAAREVFDRCFGKAKQSVDMEVEVDTTASRLEREFGDMSPLFRGLSRQSRPGQFCVAMSNCV